MRTKRFIIGLDNSQKIRVICNGVGFYTTVKGAFDMCIHHQRVAVTRVLSSLGCEQSLPSTLRPTGKGTRLECFDYNGNKVFVDVQVDLVDK